MSSIKASVVLMLSVMATATIAKPITSRQSSSLRTYSTCTQPNTIALTFDDGPYSFAPTLDSTLAKNKAIGNFFINGNNYGCIYDYANLLKQRFAAGHFLASHGWGHAHMGDGNATAGQLHKQLRLLETAFIKILGVKPLYFRPPYGESNPLLVQVLAQRGYKGLIMWDQDSGDSATPTPSTQKMISDVSSYPAKSLVLSHETYEWTVKTVTPAVLPKLVQRGLKVVSVPQCLGISAKPADWYVKVGAPGVRDATWTCNGLPAPGEL